MGSWNGSADLPGGASCLLFARPAALQPVLSAGLYGLLPAVCERYGIGIACSSSKERSPSLSPGLLVLGRISAGGRLLRR
jgi:hypothetical protein